MKIYASDVQRNRGSSSSSADAKGGLRRPKFFSLVSRILGKLNLFKVGSKDKSNIEDDVNITKPRRRRAWDEGYNHDEEVKNEGREVSRRHSPVRHIRESQDEIEERNRAWEEGYDHDEEVRERREVSRRHSPRFGQNHSRRFRQSRRRLRCEENNGFWEKNSKQAFGGASGAGVGVGADVFLVAISSGISNSTESSGLMPELSLFDFSGDTTGAEEGVGLDPKRWFFVSPRRRGLARGTVSGGELRSEAGTAATVAAATGD
ncbi:hypothetical protein U1Q18_005793 [Sarracenia purpurea var. burkii]